MRIRAERSPKTALLSTAAAIVLAACGGGSNSTSISTSATPVTSGASATPSSTSNAAFDPCTALMSQFLSEHRWNARTPTPKQDSTGDFQWKGCLYVAQSTYTFRVQTTNGSLAQVRETFPAATELTIDGRTALRYEARPDVPGGCAINIDMKSGSLYILVDDPRGLHPRKLSPCDNVTEIAQAIVPLLPRDS
ncbi:DUF3558 domain-containing protein [Nocardia pseudovaccinii]|uniref:DUF3558 domain-containing protein n=1 Tax=Nocardia pseudovaccinii TaxID=189540 RepID=UPI0007A4DFF0|nr:DUF3558 domain-containing protein [Nocardia pseudovaccinii]